MKKICLKLLALALTLCLLIPPAAAAGTGASEDHGPVTVLFTHDMHSHLEKFPKLKTVVDKERAENHIVYLLDAGDFAMGTPYQAIFQDEAPELRMMGALGFDITTLGNHEFDQRSKGLSRMLNTAVASGEKLPLMVNSNIDWDKTLTDEDYRDDAVKLREALDNYGSKAYTVIEKGGVKMAVFGIFGKQSAEYAPESGTYFLDPVEAAKDVVRDIEENEDVDLVVCISHSGTDPDPEKSEDEILAREVDGIDMIVSAHSHTVLEQPIIISGTVVASAGSYNNYLGKATFTYQGGEYKMSGYELIPLDSGVRDDPAIAALLTKFKGLVNKEYFARFGLSWDQVLAENRIPFTDIDSFGATYGEDTLGNIISDALVYGVKYTEGADYERVAVAVAPLGCIRASFDVGPVTVEEAFNALALGTGADGVAGYPLVSVYLYGKELKLAAEIDASVSDIMAPARLYFSGLEYTYNPHRMFLNRAYDIRLRGDGGEPVEIEDDKLYRVVADLYSAQMLGAVEAASFGLISITPKDRNENPISDYEKHIICGRDGAELKEWYALAVYFKSFEDGRVPAKYAAPEGRKAIDDEGGIIAFFRQPNKFFYALMGIIAGLILIIALIAFLIVRYAKKTRRKKAEKRVLTQRL